MRPCGACLGAGPIGESRPSTLLFAGAAAAAGAEAEAEADADDEEPEGANSICTIDLEGNFFFMIFSHFSVHSRTD